MILKDIVQEEHQKKNIKHSSTVSFGSHKCTERSLTTKPITLREREKKVIGTTGGWGEPGAPNQWYWGKKPKAETKITT